MEGIALHHTISLIHCDTLSSSPVFQFAALKQLPLLCEKVLTSGCFRIMKRNLGQEQFITPKKILEVLGGATGEIAAIFINTKEVGGQRVATTMQYFDRQSLRDFLYYNDPTRNGILQKFLSIKQQRYASASVTNQILNTMHVTWKKGELRTTKVVQRSHFLRIVQANDVVHGKQPYQYATADPLQYGQVTLPLQSHLSRKIREACERIAEHVRIVTDNAVRMTRMVGYFKVGHKGQLWFNFPTSVDVEDSGIDHTFELPVAMPFTTPRVASNTGSRDATYSANLVSLKTRDKSDKAFAMKNQANLFPCAFCADTVESTVSCSMTLHQVISFLDQSNADGADKASDYEQSQDEQDPAERASRMWAGMRLGVDHEITLPELRWRMKLLPLSHDHVERIETGIALSDAEISGVIDLHLWTQGVIYSVEQATSPSARATQELSFSRGRTDSDIVTPRGSGDPSSPTYLSVTKQPQSPESMQDLLHAIMTGSRDLDSIVRAAAAGGSSRRRPMEPRIMTNLRATLPPKILMQITAPGAIERESRDLMNKNVEVCSSCHQSVGSFLSSRGGGFWDAQLQRLLQPTAGQSIVSPKATPRRRPSLIDQMWSRFALLL